MLGTNCELEGVQVSLPFQRQHRFVFLFRSNFEEIRSDKIRRDLKQGFNKTIKPMINE